MQVYHDGNCATIKWIYEFNTWKSRIDYSRVSFINLMKFVDFSACNHGTMNQFQTLRHMSYSAITTQKVRYIKRNNVNFRG
jgi:hypothetical protein